MADVVLIQPTDGLYGKTQMFLPVGLLYTSSVLNHEGYKIKIIDMRVEDNWEKTLIKELKDSPTCVGITVKTGIPILDGLKASRLVKEHDKDIPVVWGGVHSSILPEQTLQDKNIDFVVQGEGEYTLYELVKALENGKPDFSDIRGLWYKKNSKPKSAPLREFANLDDLPDLPYNLIEIKKYTEDKYHFDEGTVTLQTSRGCPYRCTFCYNNTFNRSTWRAMSPERVMEQIKFLVNKHKIKGFQVVDDNFFANAKRVNKIFELIEKEGLDIKLYFQGARVDAIGKMSRDELQRLERRGATYLQFGVESGSQKILDMVNKKIRVEQVVDLNKKLRKYTTIKPIYNFMIGFPTETEHDISQTTHLYIRLLDENPNAVVRYINILNPYPGTEIYNLAIQHGFKPPVTLEEWGHQHWLDFSRACPWLSEEMKDRIKRIVYASFGANRNLSDYFESPIKRLLFKIYHPLAKFRLKHDFYYFMPEATFDIVGRATKFMLDSDTDSRVKG